jgi:hypothetical protein
VCARAAEAPSDWYDGVVRSFMLEPEPTAPEVVVICVSISASEIKLLSNVSTLAVDNRRGAGGGARAKNDDVSVKICMRASDRYGGVKTVYTYLMCHGFEQSSYWLQGYSK